MPSRLLLAAAEAQCPAAWPCLNLDRSCLRRDGEVGQYEVRAHEDEKGYPRLDHVDKISQLKNTTSQSSGEGAPGFKTHRRSPLS